MKFFKWLLENWKSLMSLGGGVAFVAVWIYNHHLVWPSALILSICLCLPLGWYLDRAFKKLSARISRLVRPSPVANLLTLLKHCAEKGKKLIDPQESMYDLRRVEQEYAAKIQASVDDKGRNIMREWWYSAIAPALSKAADSDDKETWSAAVSLLNKFDNQLCTHWKAMLATVADSDAAKNWKQQYEGTIGVVRDAVMQLQSNGWHFDWDDRIKLEK